MTLLYSYSLDDAKQKLTALASLYRDDLPFSVSVESEIHCWQVKWRTERDAAGPDSLPQDIASSPCPCHQALAP